MKRLILACLLMPLVSMAQAQEDVWEWFQNQRPEHIVEDANPQSALKAPRRIGSQATAPLHSRGEQHVPVVLVAFADKVFTAADGDDAVREFYDKFCNGTMDGKLYTGHGSHGSIRDYFVEQSDSVFFPLFTIIGPVTLDSCYAYYGKNSGDSKDVNFSKFRDEAIVKAIDLHTDWGRFDNDGNGSIDMVFFVYAGLGENSGGDEDCIWPKESTAKATISGRVFATSAATCECRPRSKDENGHITATRTDGVGVFIHELSHALGLPDFYDTNYKGFGMDLWSVMDYGEYGNNGYNPGNYTAYERDFMGWRPLKTLTEPCIVTIPCFADGGYGYKIQNPASANEYYVIENRQAKGWDDQIGRIGHGLQVTHVDYNAEAWNGNRVNTVVNHQRMTIIAANNNYNGTNATKDAKVWQAAISGHLYPGDTFNYELTDESTPAAAVYEGGLMHKPLRNITENEDGTITLCFRTNGQLEAPASLEVGNILMDGADARWEPVDNATTYAYELYSEEEELLVSGTTIDNACRLEGLPSSSHLSLRVRALADSPEDYLPSEWSDGYRFDTLADYIDSVADSDQWVEVFSTNGVCVSRCRSGQVGRLDLRRGVYVVRCADGSVRKVLMR